MNEKILKKVWENRISLVPAIFTLRQIDIISKHIHKKNLTNSEKTYLYSTIKKKIDALHSLQEEFHICGEQMIPERVEKAKKILKEINKKAFISGSFLYKKDYRDIDIYILSDKRKSYHKENRHFIYLTKKMISNPIFISSLKYSVANFSLDIKPELKRPPFEHLNLTYQMAINEILNKEEERTLRELVFMYFLHIKKIILDSFTLYLKTEEIIKTNNHEKIKRINEMMKELVLKLYSKKYMYLHLSQFVNMLKKDYASEPYDNYPIFINLFTEVKNECRT
ncbi:hypothetical protein J4444_02390 [Candidatus Woesearchaeota archaeon]|nr:hypothetical protein [Candidatus Woesearchaeota archaeon]